MGEEKSLCSGEFECPCGKHEKYKSVGHRRKERYAKARKEGFIGDYPAEELPFAYAIPVADGYKKEARLENVYLEGAEKAARELLENLSYRLPYIPHEPLPTRSIDEESHGINELRKVVKYWTQLMTPRQVLCYAKLVKRLRERRDELGEDVYDWLVMLLLKSLQQNVLTRIETGKRGIKHISSIQSLHLAAFPVEATIPGYSEGSFTSIFGSLKKYTGIKVKGLKNTIKLKIGFPVLEGPEIPRIVNGLPEVVVLNDAVQNLDKYKNLHKAFDAAFIDPPYLSMIPYRDLSHLYHVRMKKLKEVKPLEDIYHLDLTTRKKDDYEEFSSKMYSALSSLSKLIKNDGFMVLQFAPPTSADFDKLWSHMMAAILASGLYPLMAASFFAETSKESASSGEGVSRTMLILIGKRPLAEHFLSHIVSLSDEYTYDEDIDDEEQFNEVKEYIRHVIRGSEFHEFLSKILNPDVSPISMNLFEASALASSLAALIVGYLMRTSRSKYRDIILELTSELRETILNIYIKDLFGLDRIFLENDLSMHYAYALYFGYIDQAWIKKAKNIIFEDNNRGRTSFLKKPKYVKDLIKDLYNKNKNRFKSEAPMLYSLIDLYDRYKRLEDEDLVESLRRIIHSDSEFRDFIHVLIKGLNAHRRRIEDAEEISEASGLFEFISKALS